jgi:hypothetical protein
MIVAIQLKKVRFMIAEEKSGISPAFSFTGNNSALLRDNVHQPFS